MNWRRQADNTTAPPRWRRASHLLPQPARHHQHMGTWRVHRRSVPAAVFQPVPLTWQTARHGCACFRLKITAVGNHRFKSQHKLSISRRNGRHSQCPRCACIAMQLVLQLGGQLKAAGRLDARWNNCAPIAPDAHTRTPLCVRRTHTQLVPLCAPRDTYFGPLDHHHCDILIATQRLTTTHSSGGGGDSSQR